MHKRLILRNLVAVFLLVLSSCKRKGSEEKIPLLLFKGAVQETEKGKKGYFCSLSDTDLTFLRGKKASFPLFIYAEGCGTCDLFSYTRQGYIKKEGVLFPFMTLSNYLRANPSSSLTESALVFYSKGSIVKQVKNLEEDYSDTDDFTSLIHQYCFPSSRALLNGFENRLGLTYSSQYPVYRIETAYTGSLPFSNDEKEGKPLCLVDKDLLSDYSSLKGIDASFYFLDDASLKEKGQQLSNALGLVSLDYRENGYVLIG